MHHLIGNLSDYSVGELEEKVRELQKKYFQSYNPQIQDQIIQIMKIYNDHIYERREKEAKKQESQINGNLDSYINIS